MNTTYEAIEWQSYNASKEAIKESQGGIIMCSVQ